MPIDLPSGERYFWPKRVLITGYAAWNGDVVWETIAELTKTTGFVWETRLNIILKHQWQLGLCLFASDVCRHMCIINCSGTILGTSAPLRQEDGGYNKQKTGFDQEVMHEVARHNPVMIFASHLST